MYDWVCEDPDAAVEAELIKKGVVPDEYPHTWPSVARRVLPSGTAPFSACDVAAIAIRKNVNLDACWKTRLWSIIRANR